MDLLQLMEDALFGHAMSLEEVEEAADHLLPRDNKCDRVFP